MNIEPSSFPASVWDGLNYQFTTLDFDKNPDFHSKDRITSEIQAIESYLIDFSGIFSFFEHLPTANAFVTVNNDHTALAYRTLIGDGIEITYTSDEVTLKNLGRWTEQVENASGGPVTIGQVVRLKSTGKFDLALANNFTTSEILGLVADAIINNGVTGTIQIAGPIETTTLIWDSLTGQTGGLTPNTIYYLNETINGSLTIIPPTTEDSCVVRVGKALTTTKLLLYPHEPIEL
jgi:hypothetical protein